MREPAATWHVGPLETVLEPGVVLSWRGRLCGFRELAGLQGLVGNHHLLARLQSLGLDDFRQGESLTISEGD